MNKNIHWYIVGLIILFLGFILGALATLSYGYGRDMGCQTALKEIETKYQKETTPVGEIEEIERVEEAEGGEMSEKVFSYNGEITNIENQTIIMKARVSEVVPFEEERFETKRVKIAETTEVVQLIEKAPEEMETPAPGVIVEPFKEEKISFSDLNIGDEIIVRAKEDIKGKEEFVASKITKLPSIPE